MAADRDRIARLARRAGGGDLAAARELVRELEARREPDEPGRWDVIGTPAAPGALPPHMGVRPSRSEAVKLAMKLGADETGFFGMVARREPGYAPSDRPWYRVAVSEIQDLGLLRDLLEEDPTMGLSVEHPGYVSATFATAAGAYEVALGWDGDVGPYGSLRTLEGDDLETYYYDLGGGFDDQVDWIARTIRKAYADAKSGRFA